MKNKNLIQEQKAKEQKIRLAEIKAKRRGEVNLEREAPKLEEKPTILIYCEGKNTEPSYFNKFRLSSLTIDSFGEGRNTISLVEKAKQLCEKKKYDQIWCVFDADPKQDNPKQLENFNNAIKLANKLNFGVAYSNQAFEYWLILHFEDHQGGAMDRTKYGGKINKYINKLGAYYDNDGSKIIEQDFFNLLNEIVYVDIKGKKFSRCDLAINRAEKIYNRLDHSNPSIEESSTTIFKLVKELKKYE
ncbi:MAG: RloB family protein [Leadbetterella sp.]